MSNLLSAWITLFDEKSFVGLENCPEELRNISMLFITLQKHIRGVEETFAKKIENLKSQYNSYEIEQSVPMKENIPKHQLSPTLNKHRKIKSRKIKLTNIENIYNTPKKTCIPQIDDIIIEETPATNKSKSRTKRSDNTLNCPTFSSLSREITEPSGMDIEEILQKVDAADDTHQIEGNLCSQSLMWDYQEDFELKSPLAQEVVQVEINHKTDFTSWSCKDCEIVSKNKSTNIATLFKLLQFYKNMELSTKELEEKMKICAKHAPRVNTDDTIPGYWDMTIPETNVKEEVRTGNTSKKENSDESFRFFQKPL